MGGVLQVLKILCLILAIGFGVYYVSLLAGAGFSEGVLKSLRRSKHGEGKEQKSDVQTGS